nr:hypothetical protein [Tanacetum cinerariifolium]
MPYMEESGLVPKILTLKSFVIPEGQLTNEDVMDHVKEMKRLADLKAEKKKSQKSLQKILNPVTIKVIRLQDANQRGIEGLAECKASASNLRRIQVKDIVKKVENHLKTYLSDRMDIN